MEVPLGFAKRPLILAALEARRIESNRKVPFRRVGVRARVVR
jgi:hypothetical protein